MKREEVPGFAELRRALYQNRLREQYAVDAEERTEIVNERLAIRHEVAKLLYDYKMNQEQESEER